jgi:hypothetical protein
MMNGKYNVGFEVFTAVIMKSTDFWDVMLCSLIEIHWHFERTVN